MIDIRNLIKTIGTISVIYSYISNSNTIIFYLNQLFTYYCNKDTQFSNKKKTYGYF